MLRDWKISRPGETCCCSRTQYGAYFQKPLSSIFDHKFAVPRQCSVLCAISGNKPFQATPLFAIILFYRFMTTTTRLGLRTRKCQYICISVGGETFAIKHDRALILYMKCRFLISARIEKWDTNAIFLYTYLSPRILFYKLCCLN